MTTPEPRTAAEQGAAEVRTRRVYYISGFDPRGAAYYHRLYREESARQSVHHDGSINVGPRSRKRADFRIETWPVDAQWRGAPVSTEYQFLAWDDIVRRRWEPRLFRLVFASFHCAGEYVSSGAFRTVRKTFSGPLYATVYAVGYFFLLLLATALLGYAAARGAGAMGGGAFSVLPGIAAGAGALWGGLRLAERLGVMWLLRIYLFVYRWGARGEPDLDARIKLFAQHIVREQAERPCDEVLLVGHSVGSMVAASVGARLAETLPAEHRGNLTLLTLGQCIPMLSLVSAAHAFRADLATLAQARDIAWLDMNAQADALCFSQANPLDISGIAGSELGRPVRQVVRPFRMFDAATYARLRRDKLRLHFQYMKSSALPNEYDYFRITAGPDRIKPF